MAIKNLEKNKITLKFKFNQIRNTDSQDIGKISNMLWKKKKYELLKVFDVANIYHDSK